VRALPKVAPKALLIVSAHWEARAPTVLASERPPLLYDYYGFPASSYSIAWPAPGQPAVAARVRELLGKAGIESESDPGRGFDHGAFIPFKLTYPDAEIPAVQLSLKAGLDAAEHLAIGRAIAPLRDEGVFILGSGMSYHNMRGFRDPSAASDALEFDAWLREAAVQEQSERDRRLTGAPPPLDGGRGSGRLGSRDGCLHGRDVRQANLSVPLRLIAECRPAGKRRDGIE
jgi:aromatic ring-opening dioxygenase catalytic subunit (LigB family)